MTLPKVYVFIGADGYVLSVSSDKPVEVIQVDYSPMATLDKHATLKLEQEMRKNTVFTKSFYGDTKNV
jgi:hypothetical protein